MENIQLQGVVSTGAHGDLNLRQNLSTNTPAKKIVPRIMIILPLMLILVTKYNQMMTVEKILATRSITRRMIKVTTSEKSKILSIQFLTLTLISSTEMRLPGSDLQAL